jgi:hypothetical protein
MVFPGEVSSSRSAVIPGRRRAFFFLGRSESGGQSGYYHIAIMLAEGLRQNGWAISSDTAAWRPDVGSQYLFPGGALEEARTADLVVIGEDWFRHRTNRLPPWVLSGNTPTVYINRSDISRDVRTIYSREARRYSLILRTHANRSLRYPRNFAPAVFGVSERIARACSSAPSSLRSGVMWNYRISRFPHSVRELADRTLKSNLARQVEVRERQDSHDIPAADAYEQLMRKQTEGRHFTSYYESLQSCQLCACFCGWFLLPVKHQEAGTLCRLGKNLLSRTGWYSPVMGQWDSWRLWEAFAAGTVVLHVDFERHGFLLPGPLPVAMKHYIPVDLKNPRQSLRGILDDADRLREIGEAGRRWAMEFYTSKAQARNVLAHLGLEDETRIATSRCRSSN